MQLLAGLICGMVITMVLLKQPLTINLNKTETITHEEIYPEVKEPGKLSDAMGKPDAAEDEAYASAVKGVMDIFNESLGTGGNK